MCGCAAWAWPSSSCGCGEGVSMCIYWEAGDGMTSAPTSICILKPLPKPSKISETPDDLCVVFLYCGSLVLVVTLYDTCAYTVGSDV